jgi:hypothetical protein
VSTPLPREKFVEFREPVGPVLLGVGALFGDDLAAEIHALIADRSLDRWTSDQVLDLVAGLAAGRISDAAAGLLFSWLLITHLSNAKPA